MKHYTLINGKLVPFLVVNGRRAWTSDIENLSNDEDQLENTIMHDREGEL